MTESEHEERLDLPLAGEREGEAGGEARGGGPTGWDGGSAGIGGEEPPAPAGAPGRAASSRRRWPLVLLAVLALLVLLALAGVVGYLLPRPGPPVLRVATPFVEFGAVRVGETAAAREVTLESTGERPVRIGDVALAGPAAGEFELAADGCSGTSLAPGRSCTLVVRFAPRRAAARRATLEVPAEASNGSASVPLTGEGVAPEPVVDRRGLDFAPVPVGAPSRPELLTLGNRGGAPLAVAGMRVEGAAAEDFVLDGDRCTGETLEAGDECTVRVVFAPDAEGERRAVLRFRFAGTDGETPLEVALSGVAIGARPGEAPAEGSPGLPAEETPPPPAELAVTPGSLDFGETPVGAETEAEEVVLRNTGGSPARIDALALAGPDPAAFTVDADRCAGSRLAPGERCTVRVGFLPRQEGVQQARLELRSPDLPEEQEGPRVSLRGAGAVARLTLSAPALAFGEVRMTGSAERRLVLGNAGRIPLTIRDLGVRGEGARDFSVADNGCPETVPLAPGEHCEVSVRFAPAQEGERAATLVVRHGGAGPDGVVRLAGTGLPAPAPRAAVAPGTVSFGGVPVGRRSAIETVTLTNRGSARLVPGDARIEGADAGDFHVVPGSCAGATFLVPGSECTVGVRFSPSGAGERRARLVIPHDAAGGRAVIELTGTGAP